jgi:hypothetical protein
LCFYIIRGWILQGGKVSLKGRRRRKRNMRGLVPKTRKRKKRKTEMDQENIGKKIRKKSIIKIKTEVAAKTKKKKKRKGNDPKKFKRKTKRQIGKRRTEIGKREIGRETKRQIEKRKIGRGGEKERGKREIDRKAEREIEKRKIGRERGKKEIDRKAERGKENEKETGKRGIGLETKRVIEIKENVLKVEREIERKKKKIVKGETDQEIDKNQGKRSNVKKGVLDQDQKSTNMLTQGEKMMIEEVIEKINTRNGENKKIRKIYLNPDTSDLIVLPRAIRVTSLTILRKWMN